MTPWQAARQIKHLLESATWSDGAEEAVLGSVRVAALTDEEAFGLLRTPYAIMNAGEAVPDPETPGFFDQAFSLALGVRVAGSQFGEEAMLGGVRAGGAGSSRNRGLLEVEEEVLKIIETMTAANGVNATAAWKGAAAGALIEGLGHVVQRTYRIEVPCTSERYYPPIRDLAWYANTLSWTLPADRYDFWMVRIFRKSGSSPPEFGEGTEVDIDDPTSDESVTDALAGTWTYAAWALYDESHGETGQGTAMRRSTASTEVPGSVLTVAP